MDDAISILGETNARNERKRFGIRQVDRLFHLYVIGRTGTGKSTLLETLAFQDITAGRGLAVIDPHGDLVTRLFERVPDARRQALRYFAAADPASPYGYNPLRGVRADKVPLAASGLLDAMKKLWADAWGVRMEHVLRNALYGLIEYGEAKLPDILRILADPVFRRQVTGRISNPQVRAFWDREFPQYHPRYRQEVIAPLQNKVGALLADPRLYRIFVAPPVDLHFRKLMDEGGILLVNLSKGELGEDSANLLGAILVSTLELAALSRADVAPAARRPFFLYVDEFQSITTLAMANMISELRKYGVGLVLANQHLAQLEEAVRHAVLGNCGSLVAFRVGPEDARVIGKELEPVFEADDLTFLPNRDIYVKLMISGSPSKPFSATTLRPDDLALGKCGSP